MGRAGKRQEQGRDLLGPSVLGIGILISGAALAVWVVPLLRSTPTAEVRSDATIPPTVESKPEPRAVSPNDAMAAFFDAAKPTPAVATPALNQFAGTWTATVVSVDVEGDQAPIRDPRGLAPFTFTIAAAAGGWQMASADGRGAPRTLAAGPGDVVARGDGAPDVHLSFRDGRLVGVIATEKPAKGRIEFHATKAP